MVQFITIKKTIGEHSFAFRLHNLTVKTFHGDFEDIGGCNIWCSFAWN